MGEIKSALEIALEKADKLGKLDKAELEAQKWMDEGRKIAAKYMNDPEQTDLRSQLSNVPPEHLSKILQGIMDVLLRNIILPREDEQWQLIKKAMNGIKDIKGSTAEQALAQMEQLLHAYQQTRNQYLEQVKAQMQGRLGDLKQAVAQQYGMDMAEQLDVETIPEFQQEWAKISSEIQSQFEQQLMPLKEYLRQL